MSGRSWKRYIGLMLGLFAATGAGYGQGDRGLITGVVRDASAGVIPGAVVRATNVATNVGVQAETNAQGAYTLNLLQPGTYSVTAERDGFKTSEQRDVIVRVDDRIALDFVMQVGQVAERINVEARPPLLESASSSIGTVIDNRRITDLPLVHGNPLMLQFLSPGITFNGNPAWTRPFDSQAAATTVNGSQRGGLEFQLDGIPNNSGRGPAYQPSVEFIQEYKVQSVAYDATQGHASAGWVSISLKGGTNEVHGSAYMYIQNKALNANQFFNNMARQPKADYAFNRPGFGVGGPVVKNRTFWFFGYERIKHNSPLPSTLTVPTPEQKNGDFSRLLALSTAYQLYDPMTTTPAAGGRYTRQPFAGNIIPQSRFSPVGKAVIGYYPNPNQAGSADGGNNFLFGQGIEPDRYYSISSRLDHVFNERHRIFGRLVLSRRNDGPYSNYFPGVTGNNYYARNRGALLDYVYMINPQTVLNARYGYTRNYVVRRVEATGFDVTTIGMPRYLNEGTSSEMWKFPHFAPSGASAFQTLVSNGNFHNIHTWDADVSRTQGKHFIRSGAEYRGYQFNTYAYNHSTGYYPLGSFMNGPFDNSAAAPRGTGLAALLLGIPGGGGYIERNDSFAGANPHLALYIQDDWKATNRLTVNAGLRYEIEGAPSERFNRSVLGFDYDAASPIAARAQAAYAANPLPELAASQFRVNGGLTFAGTGGQPAKFWTAPRKNFMPRIGLAYRLSSNTVMRAGFGLFFDFLGVAAGWTPIQSGYSQQTPLVPTVDNGVTFVATLANPFPSGLNPSRGNHDGLATFLGKSVTFFNQQPRTPYNQRWSYGLQRQFGNDWLLDVSYVGNRGTALQTNRQLNGVPLQYLSTSRVRDQATIDRLSRSVPNPFAGLIPDTGLNAANATANQLLRPYPQFTGVSVNNNQGYSWYHGLQSRVEKRFSNGYTAMAAWTWGKNMEAVEYLNAMDPVTTEVISADDRKHRIALNGIYELPFGKGRRFGGSLRGPAGRIVSGWQINAMYQIQSGQPFGFGDFIYYGDAANITRVDQRTRVRWFNTDGFERDTRRQLASNVRYQPLRFAGVRGDKLHFLDCSLIKKTAITERVSMDFRAEFVNALNHTVFNPPNSDPTSTNFGVVTSAVALPRTIQFGIVARF